MFRLHRSNRAEPLLARLAATLRDEPLADPFAPEYVAVPSAGTQRWVSQELSRVLGASPGPEGLHGDGVCANVAFRFPAWIVGRALAAVEGDVGPSPDPWAPERLVWPILEVLPGLLDTEPFEPLRAHLTDSDGTPIAHRRFPLARRIADLFDRYALYRRDLVVGWSTQEPDDSDDWQPLLWWELRTRLALPSLAERVESAVTALAGTGASAAGPTQLSLADAEPSALPERLTVFGVASLPPAYLEVLAALGRRIPVDVYLLAPSLKPWTTQDPPSDGVHAGNPLLGSLGRLARDVPATMPRADAYHDDVVEPATDHPTLLELLQSDITADRRRGGDGVDAAPPVVLDEDDDSVQVHACHGPTRQVEVLRDSLLALLDDHDDLEPRDIVVMTPDIDAYAPIISAVFSAGERYPRAGDGGRWGSTGTPQLPFQIADRSVRATNPVAAVLAAVLDLVGARVSASAVVDVLAAGPVRARFGITPGDLDRIEGWVRDTGIRWGISPAHREAHGLPPDPAHTWEAGLDRLLLGIAMADDGDRVVGDVVPFDDVEGADVEVAGRLAAACDVLFAALDDLADPRPVAAWRGALHDTLDALTSVASDDAWQVRHVREAIDDLVAESGVVDPSPVALTLSELRDALGSRLEERPSVARYRTGGITFCGLVPLRAVPSEVVCLLGLDDGVFPRTPSNPAFDRIAADPRPGDRDPRLEDRQLLLDALLAARRHVIITYTGYDPRTNEAKPPAVPVVELLDVLDDSVALPEGSCADRLVTHHALQAFSPGNYGCARRGEPIDPVGFDLVMLEGARQLHAERADPTPFVTDTLPPPDTEEQQSVIELDDLIWFFDNPARYLLVRRLQLALGEDERTLSDHEPFDLGNLERWQVGDTLLARRLRPDTTADDVERWRAATLRRGTVPTGTPGAYLLDEIGAAVDSIMDACGAFEAVTDPVTVDVTVPVTVDGQESTRRVVGSVRGLAGTTLLTPQYSKVSAKARLRQWLRLLALSAHDSSRGWDACLVARDTQERVTRVPLAALTSFLPHLEPWCEVGTDVAPPASLLGRLVTVFERGQRRPLPYAATTSEAYASTHLKDCAAEGPHGADCEDANARRKAERAWEPQQHEGRPGDSEDRYIAQLYGHNVDFAEFLERHPDFVDTALEVWAPVLTHEHVSKVGGAGG